MAQLAPEFVSSLISDIYDCALAPERWSPTLSRLAQAVNAAYASITLSSLPYQEAVLAAHSPWNEAALKVLNEHFISEIPGLGDVIYGPLDVPASSLGSGGEVQFRQTRFYREWVEPNGLRDASMCKIAQTGDRVGIATIVMPATRDLVTQDEHRMLQLLAPHLRRAVMIGDLLEQRQLALASYARLIDAMASPVILADKHGRVHQLNAAAEAVIATGAAIRLVNGHLVSGAGVRTEGLAGERTPFRSLAQAIERAAMGDASLGQRGIGIALQAPGQPPVVAYVLPLQVSDVRSAFNAAAVAIFLSTRETSQPAMESILATLYELTPSEIRVLSQLMRGLSITEIACELAVSDSTVTTHLKHIYEKTQTNKQSQLVALTASLNTPVAAGSV
jgi:DNA-binding NarL/FixJ family response regulator